MVVHLMAILTSLILSLNLFKHIHSRYLFIIWQDSALQTLINLIKENYFTHTHTHTHIYKKGCGKEKKRDTLRQYPAETITETDYTDDLALPAYIPGQVEFLLYSLQQAAGGIGYHKNANKTELMCFKQKGANSTKWQASKISRQVPILW